MANNEKFLIVDDNVLLCWAMKKIIGDQNLHVETAYKGSDALDALSRNIYDSVFLDIHLPDLNGFDLLENIRKTSPNTKVIIMTSEDSEYYKQKAIAEGAFQYVTKPFSTPEIRDIVSNILATKYEG